jgi:hypothetical protein
MCIACSTYTTNFISQQNNILRHRVWLTSERNIISNLQLHSWPRFSLAEHLDTIIIYGQWVRYLALTVRSKIKIRTKDLLNSIRQKVYCKQKLSKQILLFSFQDADATFTSHLLSIELWHPEFTIATNSSHHELLISQDSLSNLRDNNQFQWRSSS